MGQKVHPNGMRLGIVKDFNAKWYADKTDYSKFCLLYTSVAADEV